MARTPPYPKGLADTRARAAGALEVRQQITDQLGAELSALEQAAARIRDCLARSKASALSLSETVGASDRLLKRYDGDLDPAGIPSVRPNARYGKRGAFSEALKECFLSNGNEPLSTPQLARALEARFGLEFELPAIHQKWMDGTLRTQLRLWARQGVLERVGRTRSSNQMATLWRLKDNKRHTLAEIATQERAAGRAVTRARSDD